MIGGKANGMLVLGRGWMGLMDRCVCLVGMERVGRGGVFWFVRTGTKWGCWLARIWEGLWQRYERCVEVGVVFISTFIFTFCHFINIYTNWLGK